MQIIIRKILIIPVAILTFLFAKFLFYALVMFVISEMPAFQIILYPIPSFAIGAISVMCTYNISPVKDKMFIYLIGAGISIFSILLSILLFYLNTFRQSFIFYEFLSNFFIISGCMITSWYISKRIIKP